MKMEEFLKQFAASLAHHPQVDEIVREMASHIEEKANEFLLAGFDEEISIEKVLETLGHPKRLAAQYKVYMTPEKSFRQFIIMNYILFAAGIALTVFYNLYPNPWIVMIWDALVHVKWILLGLYAGGWGYIGFWLGKEYGMYADRVVQQNGFVWIPNFLFMLLILYSTGTHSWFMPLLTPTFVLVCSFVTLLFIPIQKWSYKRGLLRL